MELSARAVLGRPALWVPGHAVTVDETLGTAARTRMHLREIRRALPGVVDEALRSAGLPVAAIEDVVFVSGAGFAMTPITGWMISKLGFRSGLRQIPVPGTGYAAGVAAIHRAYDVRPARPGAGVLVVACELGSSAGRPAGDAIGAAVVRGPGGNGREVRRDTCVPPEALRREVVARYGDLASVTVLAVLQRFFDPAS